MSGDATEVFSAVCGASIRKVKRPYSHKPKVHQRSQERTACGSKLRWTGWSSIQAGRAVPTLVQLVKEKQKDSRDGFAPRLCPDMQTEGAPEGGGSRESAVEEGHNTCRQSLSCMSECSARDRLSYSVRDFATKAESLIKARGSC